MHQASSALWQLGIAKLGELKTKRADEENTDVFGNPHRTSRLTPQRVALFQARVRQSPSQLSWRGGAVLSLTTTRLHRHAPLTVTCPLLPVRSPTPVNRCGSTPFPLWSAALTK